MMKKELELKFVLNKNEIYKVFEEACGRIDITQGYLFGSSHFRIRCQIMDGTKSATMTIKSDRDGFERSEFEYDVPYEEGLVMIDKFADVTVSKTRYLVLYKNNTWEVDDFHGRNAGLELAELEIPQLDYNVEMPSWLEQKNDVSDDDRYYNYNLAINPYSEWKNEG